MRTETLQKLIPFENIFIQSPRLTQRSVNTPQNHFLGFLFLILWSFSPFKQCPVKQLMMVLDFLSQDLTSRVTAFYPTLIQKSQLPVISSQPIPHPKPFCDTGPSRFRSSTSGAHIYVQSHPAGHRLDHQSQQEPLKHLFEQETQTDLQHHKNSSCMRSFLLSCISTSYMAPCYIVSTEFGQKKEHQRSGKTNKKAAFELKENKTKTEDKPWASTTPVPTEQPSSE